MRRLRGKATYSPLPAYPLPPQFTLPQLQKVYETVMGVKLSKATFRREVETQGEHLSDFVPGAAQMR